MPYDLVNSTYTYYHRCDNEFWITILLFALVMMMFSIQDKLPTLSVGILRGGCLSAAPLPAVSSLRERSWTDTGG